MNKVIITSTVALLAFAAGYGLQELRSPSHTMTGPDQAGGREPLYWVAPMDPNFRRDKPGKSPMGMDLVPVYEEDEAAADAPGTVRISPAVENNLGVRTATVERRKLPREVRTVGYVGYDEDRLHHVHLRVEGWIEKLGVTSAGDAVRRGQVLFDLYAPDIVNAQEEMFLARQSGEADLLRSARRKLEALGLAPAQVKAIEETGRVQRTVPIRAQQDGYVSMLMVRHGMFVRPQDEVMSIGQLDTIWLIAEVFEQQSGWVEAGNTVEIRTDAWPGRTWTGEVDYVYPVLDATTRTARVRIRVPNPDEALRPNMYASVRIFGTPSGETLAVPRSAVIRTGTMQRVVCALGDGRYLSTQVRTGRAAGEWLEVLDGLSEGDRVVISAQFLIDSESSLSAEFGRMEDVDEAQTHSAKESTAEQPEEAMDGMDHSGHDMDHAGHPMEKHR